MVVDALLCYTYYVNEVSLGFLDLGRWVFLDVASLGKRVDVTIAPGAVVGRRPLGGDLQLPRGNCNIFRNGPLRFGRLING